MCEYTFFNSNCVEYEIMTSSGLHLYWSAFFCVDFANILSILTDCDCRERSKIFVVSSYCKMSVVP